MKNTPMSEDFSPIVDLEYTVANHIHNIGSIGMTTATQFSVFLINKPGILAQVIDAIAHAKVNLMALTIVDSQEHGVLRLVCDSPETLREVLTKLNLNVHETQVVLLELANKSGALASAVGRLSENKVNIEYAYVTAGAPGGKTTGILKVDHVKKAEKVLEPKTQRDEKRSTVKKQTGKRR